ncbi:glycosyl hydrolase 115 family protein [Pinibacter soli]|uniref:Glycosyl hydrolase 115 family protein n=1 Tax=Pinibacter soli TaxID=3044211 RepID=A0ABT6RBH0_9BACT|nr:glycosyl hydrolase 115 family protein [Pinibacter soli]MDI3319274.1 glycosyl hydrolase 115 family protein [Pinibacter soli]
MNVLFRYTGILVFILLCNAKADAQDFSFSANGKPVMVLYTKDGPQMDSLLASLLADDIERVTSRRPVIVTDINQSKGNVIVIGNHQSNLIQSFIDKKSAIHKSLQGKWECFALKVIDRPKPDIDKAFIISGSDARGTAYGVFTLSQKIGVSPWYWWADVPVKKSSDVTVHQPEYISTQPSVKYRGIFLNDEDWGLRPWAANTFEPTVKNIGPKTYAKIFELLLRLNANFIWPAMHPGTTAFFAVPGNKEVAALYSIIIGSSHAEPMLRNNVGEWNEKTMGDFNYFTNKEKVDKYWEDRVKESIDNEVVYTMGMRGVHDGQMEGVKSAAEAVPVLEKIIKEQRELLEKYHHKSIDAVPQALTPYKEVLEFYEKGLKVPDDITLVWPDDNYGYIQRLSNEEEKKRSGRSGVYYHASYWGRPHDYLWLGTTHPALIREEMMKAYQTGADRLWVLNVGDIKPLEYDIQFFMDMAYNATPFKESSYTKKHLTDWNENVFGKNGSVIAEILWDYYNLAFERRPEFMGWSQVEPTTPTKVTTYNHFSYGDEAQHRIDKYNQLEDQVNGLRKIIDSTAFPAFYQLVYYPVVGASQMNKKFLFHDNAYIYSKQNRLSAYDYTAIAKDAYGTIQRETDYYNKVLENGKWKDMMSMKPRALPVFEMPGLPALKLDKKVGWNISPEGTDTSGAENLVLPTFLEGVNQHYFVDVFLTDSLSIQWSAVPSADWIKMSTKSGNLAPARNENQKRVWIDVDWSKCPKTEHSTGIVDFKSLNNKYEVKVNVFRPAGKVNGFVESNGIVSMYAQHYTACNNRSENKWEIIDGLGYTGRSVMNSIASSVVERFDATMLKQTGSFLAYDFVSFTDTIPELLLYAIPVHPINKNYSLRCAFTIDDGPLQLVDFKSNSIARTEEWKQNVLRNNAIRKLSYNRMKPGSHTLKIFAVDPGFILDRIAINLGGLKQAYSAIPETLSENK